MSITAETAQAHKNDPAVLCCRLEAGNVIEAANLEDPAIFDDLVDSGLLKLDGALTIGQVLGATLKVTLDSLSALTPENVSGINAAETKAVPAASEAATLAPSRAESASGCLKLHIDEGKGIDLEIPLCVCGSEGVALPTASENAQSALKYGAEEKDIVRHTLKNYAFPVKDVKIGEATSFENGVLTVRDSLVDEAVACSDIVKKVELDVIYPDKHDIYTNTMMDVQPIAVKKEGDLGEGVTFEITGAYMMLTGTDETGLQVADANVSCGIYGDNVAFGRPGAPDKDAFIVRVNVTIKEGCGMERPGPLAAHQAMDIITQEIRNVLKEKESSDAAEERIYEDIDRVGRPKVLLVKEIMGQGAMHDNLILPDEPCGFLGGRPNVDLGNVPVFLRTNEVRDGGVHALTCITPDTKEPSLFYWREPYLARLAADPEVNLIGVLFVGSPQANTEKFYVSKRLGAVIEAIKPDGCIVTTEGFGNNHVDFASHIEQIGSQDIPVVGCSYCGVQGALVVGNKYMDTMVDHCVTDDGNVRDILGLNTGSADTALRAVSMLKNKLVGVAINKAPKSYNPELNGENLIMAKEKYNVD